MKYRLTSLVLGLSLPFFILSCSGGGSTTKAHVDKSLYLEAMDNTVIVPSVTAFQEATTALTIAIDTFANDLTVSNLEDAQAQWKATQRAWQFTQGFQIGPASELESLINFWPKRPSSIESVLSDTSTLNAEAIDTFGTTKKGLPVMEYLLFDHTQTPTDVLALFTSDARRIAYLVALADDLEEQAATISQAWSTTGEHSVDTFAQTDTSFNTLLNQLIATLEIIKNSKLGKPMGKATSGDPRPDDVESQQSENSLSHIHQNLLGIQAIFTGTYAEESDLGLQAYLIANSHTALSTAVEEQLETTLSAMDNVHTPLWQAVEGEPEALETLYQEITALVRLFKVDMATALNETVHFNDSDGD